MLSHACISPETKKHANLRFLRVGFNFKKNKKKKKKKVEVSSHIRERKAQTITPRDSVQLGA
jgi:hypothetical protein